VETDGEAQLRGPSGVLLKERGVVKAGRGEREGEQAQE
jgi:hypothetical protein